jgi:hypothetical protein
MIAPGTIIPLSEFILFYRVLFLFIFTIVIKLYKLLGKEKITIVLIVFSLSTQSTE